METLTELHVRVIRKTLPSVFHFFLVGAFINKRARLLQSLVFFIIIQDRLEATNVNVQYLQLKETKRIPRERI